MDNLRRRDQREKLEHAILGSIADFVGYHIRELQLGLVVKVAARLDGMTRAVGAAEHARRLVRPQIPRREMGVRGFQFRDRLE